MNSASGPVTVYGTRGYQVITAGVENRIVATAYIVQRNICTKDEQLVMGRTEGEQSGS